MMEETVKLSSGQAGSDGHIYKRTKRIELRTSQQEFKLIRKHAFQANYNSIAQYLREAGLSNPSIQSHCKQQEALRRCQYELNRIGNNINQISHHVNTYPDNPLNKEILMVLWQIQDIADSIYKSSKEVK